MGVSKHPTSILGVSLRISFGKSVKTLQPNPANHGRESSSRKTSGPANAPNLRRKLASKLTYTVLEVRIMRQKEEAQEKKRKPSHRVKRNMSFANREQKGVPVGQRKPRAKEGRTLENSFEATLQVLANINKKSKKNGTPPTAKAAGRIPGPKNCMTQKTNMTKEGTESPKSIGQTMKKTSPNHGCGLVRQTPPESIDNYEMLRKTFLGNYSQQKKYIKDPVEIHHVKQRERESTEAFMERFKAESMHVSGVPECMKISGFMHRITNPDLIKDLNSNIPKSMDEMMSITTTFLRGEVAAANQSKKKVPAT
ncbi:hypothetical protein Tco_1399282 [Tanacetum coccineum]